MFRGNIAGGCRALVPLVAGIGISYSPLLYRPRSSWPLIRSRLVGDAVQPAGERQEAAERLNDYKARIDRAFDSLKAHLADASIDTLVVLGCDHQRLFDESNMPQLHVFVGKTIWGDPARDDWGEESARVELQCDRAVADLVAEELVWAGFDVAESRDQFRPIGDPVRGLGPSFIEPLKSIFNDRIPPIVPIHINCYVEPCISAHRMIPFGRTLSSVLEFVPGRVGMIASGGMSGDPGGYMAGWVDEVLDRWVLGRLHTGRSEDTARLFDMDSLTLHGATREIRLWTALGAAMEQRNKRARLVEDIPFHHSAVGTAMAIWE